MSVSVGLGIDTFPFANPAEFWQWLDICDVGGIDSIWQADFLVGEQPVLECISTMAAIAARTTRLKFGMSVAAVGIRDPLVTAKACATIDYLSEGRLLPAFGLGSSQAYKNFHNAYPKQNLGHRANEALEIIARLWHEDSVSFDGQFFTLKDVSISPKPVQKHLPLWIGGDSKAAIMRTARFGSGWLAGFSTPEEAKATIAEIKTSASSLGRHIPDDHYGAGFGFRFGQQDEDFLSQYMNNFSTVFQRPAELFNIVGTADAIVRQIRAYEAAGIPKLILRPIAADGEDVIRQTRYLIEQVLPLL